MWSEKSSSDVSHNAVIQQGIEAKPDREEEMRSIKQLTILLAALAVCLSPLAAQEKSSSSSKQSLNSSDSEVSSTSSSTGLQIKNSSTTVQRTESKTNSSSAQNLEGSSQSAGTRPPDTGVFSIPTERTSIRFVPRFKQRINDLGDQIRLARSKGFITPEEESRLQERQSKLLLQEADVSQKGFLKPDLDALEKAVTLLNGDVFAAMRKSDPVKSGSAEKEINDPNLIPAYTDPELQPNSGTPSAQKK
jgi:hypothetical protein